MAEDQDFTKLQRPIESSCTGNRITMDELKQMTRAAAGQIRKVYIHWTAGHYSQRFADYHLLIDYDGSIYATTDDLATPLNHTYMRNTGAMGVAAMCAFNATGNTYLGPEPPTDTQIETIAQVCAALSNGLNIPIDIWHFLTHAEAANNLDGENPCYEDNGYPGGKYGPGYSCERWDFWVVKQNDDPGSGGDILREKAIWYLHQEEEIAG